MSDTTTTPITKPGYKTTEFWLSLAATLLGVLLASGAMNNVPSDDPWAKIVGGAVAVLAAMGYTASRATVKSTSPTVSDAPAEPTSGGPA